MKVSNKGLDLIKEFEGFSSTPYLCPAGIATIGYGSTYYEDGTLVTMEDEPITEERATELLQYTTDKIFGSFVNKVVKIEINQNQFDALVSFAYNLGNQSLKESTLLRHLNDGNYEDAANQFTRWVRAGGKTLAGLVRRRNAERELFLS